MAALLFSLLAASTWAAPVFIKQDSGTHIVSFAPGTSAEARRALVEMNGGSVLREMPFVDALVVSFGMSPMAAMRLKAESTVSAVEPNRYHKWIEVSPAPMASVLIVPPAAVLNAGGSVPALGAEGPAAPQERSETPWGVARLHAPQVWARATGAGVKVGIIDTGIDGTHPDLAANYAGGYNAVTPGSDPTDDHGHGTHVAGTIAAVPNGKGVIGVAPRARLYAIKVLDKDGGGTDEVVVNGIAWCVQNGMQVVNMSLGGPSSTALHNAVRKAVAAGVTIVAASGNDPEAAVSAPASYSETIAVGASTSQDAIAQFSTTGPELDFIAPGHEIISTWPGSKLAKLSGTSMASPHVAGLAALAVELGAGSPAQVRAFLKKGAVPLAGLSKEQQGNGLVEADRWFK